MEIATSSGAGGGGPRDLFSYPRHRADLAPTPFLPMTRAEMDILGWDECDVVLVTGDAYVDLPSFGMAIIGRLLERQGFRVGILAQPDWRGPEAFRALGRPRLFWGVTAGNMDSMVNRYTSDRRTRSDDAYSPGGVGGLTGSAGITARRLAAASGRLDPPQPLRHVEDTPRVSSGRSAAESTAIRRAHVSADPVRPDRSVIVYAQRCREAWKDVPVVLGGIEASLRRVAHFDYWSEKVRRSVLLDAKADILLYGNAERAVVELAHRLAGGQRIEAITDLRGTAVLMREVPAEVSVADASTLERVPRTTGRPSVVRLPSYEDVAADPVLYAHASRVLHREANPGNARALVQRHGDRELWVNPPPIPLTTREMDRVYELPYRRVPHPSYGGANIPAYEMIRFSVTIQRGCYGGCTFCSITEHEGRIIQSRSEASVLREIERVRDVTPGFTGVVSDLGGPTANMYRTGCRTPEIEAACRRPSCLYPGVCENLRTDHSALVALYRRARKVSGIKKILIASGVRYDLAVEDPEYVKELVTHHVGGRLKIAPEHLREGPLAKMMKPGMASYYRFKELFDRYSAEAGKRQFLIPYFISAHPGTTDEDMMELALWLKRNGFQADQVQSFLPSPMATATAMYHSGKDPLHKVTRTSEDVFVPTGGRTRRLHKAFLRYHDPANWPLLREALKKMGRQNLIGPGEQHLVPWTEGGASPAKGTQPFRTQHTGLPDRKGRGRRGGR